MGVVRAALLRAIGIFRRHSAETNFSTELQSHLDMHFADNIRAGMSPDEARRRALVALGGVEQTRQLYRERRQIPILEECAQDARFGIRTLVKNRGFAVIAVLSLALGTGEPAAIFSVVNSVLLRPLPFAHPERLVQIAETSMMRDDLEALRRESSSFESFAEHSAATRVAVIVRSLGAELLAAANARAPMFGAVALILFAIALCASWLPARRVARTSPSSALKAL
ncbi:MAG: permease prefix domain 1-containing protein [Vicinamibacterales bacterium]